MWFLNFWKKAEIKLLLDKNTYSFWEIISWKLKINANDDFTSNSLKIFITPSEESDFSDLKVERWTFWSQTFKSGDEKIGNIRFNFLSKEELSEIYDKNYWDLWNENKVFFLETIPKLKNFNIVVEFDISWFDAQDSVKINII